MYDLHLSPVQKCRNMPSKMDEQMLHSASAVHAAPRLVACLLEPSQPPPPLSVLRQQHRPAIPDCQQAPRASGDGDRPCPRPTSPKPNLGTDHSPSDWACRCGRTGLAGVAAGALAACSRCMVGLQLPAGSAPGAPRLHNRVALLLPPALPAGADMPSPGSTTIGALPDALLGRVLALAGREQG